MVTAFVAVWFFVAVPWKPMAVDPAVFPVPSVVYDHHGRMGEWR